MLRDYYHLTKPGIVYGNVLTTVAGFLLASKTHFDLLLLVAVTVGTGLVIASACVVNNYIDRSIDAVMLRTQRRALVMGKIGSRQACIFATTLGILGFGVLLLGTNVLTFFVGVAAYVVYVVLYGIAKRKSVHGTLVGSVAGSAAIVAGYTAVTGRIDAAAIILFTILTAWQMPHFYAIALYRRADYAAAGLPVLPVVKGQLAARRQIIAYIVVFIVATLALCTYGFAGSTYAVVMGVVGLYWLSRSLRRYDASSVEDWARGVFKASLLVMMATSCMVALGGLLP